VRFQFFNMLEFPSLFINCVGSAILLRLHVSGLASTFREMPGSIFTAPDDASAPPILNRASHIVRDNRFWRHSPLMLRLFYLDHRR